MSRQFGSVVNSATPSPPPELTSYNHSSSSVVNKHHGSSFGNQGSPFSYPPPPAYQLDELAATANMIRGDYNPVNYTNNGHHSAAAPAGSGVGAGGAPMEGGHNNGGSVEGDAPAGAVPKGVEGASGGPTKNLTGPSGGDVGGGTSVKAAGGGIMPIGGGAGVEGGVPIIHKELISNNVQRKHNNHQQQQSSSSASLSFSSTQSLQNSGGASLSTTLASKGGLGDAINNKQEAKKSHSTNSSNPTNPSNTNSSSNNSNSTYTYKDYAKEEDLTSKIINEYTERGSSVQGSIISHEDETTKNLMQQKLPAKLAAMLSDPGELLLLLVV